MPAPVANPAAPAAGLQQDLVSAARASALRANNAAAFNWDTATDADFVAQARAMVGDSAVSVGEVNELVSKYMASRASTPAANWVEQRSRDAIDREMGTLLESLRAAVSQGKVSRDEFDTIQKLVTDAKTSPSANTFLKAKTAIQDAGGSALLGAGSGQTQVRKDQLLSEILETGNFGNANFDRTQHIYNPGANNYFRSGGPALAGGANNTQTLYDQIKSLDVSKVDGAEMSRITGAVRAALQRGNGTISDTDLRTLSSMVGVANFTNIAPPAPVQTPVMGPLPPPGLTTGPLPVVTHPQMTTAPIGANQGAGAANGPVAPAAQTPVAQAVQEVFAALMRQLGVTLPAANAQGTNAQGTNALQGNTRPTGLVLPATAQAPQAMQPAVMPAGWGLDTGSVVGPRVDWSQMYGDRVGSNFVIVPSMLEGEARNKLLLGFTNADVARDIWTQYRQQWGDVTSTPVTRFGDVAGATTSPVITLPPQPVQPPAQKQWTAVDNGNGTGLIDIGTHTIELNEASSQWTVTDKATGKQTRIWGDPHVDYNNDGSTDLDFKGDLNLMLGNTRVHIKTVPFGNGETLSSRLTISDGQQTLVVNGLAQNNTSGVDVDGDMSITRLQGDAAARAFDSTWGDQVVYQGGDGAWHVAAGKLLQGSLVLGADGKERVEFSKVDTTQRLPGIGGNVGGFTIAQQDQMMMMMQMMMQQLMEMMRRMQQQSSGGSTPPMLYGLYGGQAGG